MLMMKHPLPPFPKTCKNQEKDIPPLSRTTVVGNQQPESRAERRMTVWKALSHTFLFRDSTMLNHLLNCTLISAEQ